MYEEKIYGERVRRFTQKLEASLFDAYRKMEADRTARKLRSPLPEQVKVWSWPQIWPDSSVGFGGAGKPGAVEAQTHVVRDDVTETVYVYHDSRYVRTIERPGEPFWKRVRAHGLPGASEEEAWEELVEPVGSARS
ncbi:MAG: hypothetical protein ACRELV_02320 [Longimicrobiales bacterium]